MLYRKILALILIASFSFISAEAAKPPKVRKKDRKKDIEMVTSMGTITLRLSDSTPQHRDNFIRLVKGHYYDGIKFHRVINQFMIQAGDADTKTWKKGAPAKYTIPAEFVPSLFHHKGVLAAAREGDNVNPTKASSGTQFYIVQGKTFNDGQLDTMENKYLKGKMPAAHREVYKELGGSPHLDRNYTVFGMVVKGLEVVDSIAAVKTTGRAGNDVPVEPVLIKSVKLVKRK